MLASCDESVDEERYRPLVAIEQVLLDVLVEEMIDGALEGGGLLAALRPVADAISHATYFPASRGFLRYFGEERFHSLYGRPLWPITLRLHVIDESLKVTVILGRCPALSCFV